MTPSEVVSAKLVRLFYTQGCEQQPEPAPSLTCREIFPRLVPVGQMGQEAVPQRVHHAGVNARIEGACVAGAPSPEHSAAPKSVLPSQHPEADVGTFPPNEGLLAGQQGIARASLAQA